MPSHLHNQSPFLQALSVLLPFEAFVPFHPMAQVVIKIPAMADEKTKQKAIEAAADIYGIDSIAADLKEQKMTIIGEMDTVAIAKKLKKIGRVEIVSVGPAKEEKKVEKKEDKKDEKKDDKK
ncbi:heavy metal-associated isoprenylated plant protein 39-like isoform X2 [Aristolochia californica]|uniref:heavy metal-associated isoprenylated plant protein 39-like isoform X2 n=1 Tax=Aristolochia californica TaxID=171875 RepID=UPI0035DD1CDC